MGPGPKDEWERIFNALPDLIMTLDRENRIVRASRSLAERLGVPAENLVGLLCHRVIHGTDRPPGFCPHALLLRDEREHTADVAIPAFGGHFSISASPLHDANGMLVGSVHVARDITARRSAETALKESEQRFSALLNAATDSALLLGAEGTILALNRTAALGFGLNPHEVLGRCSYDMMPAKLASSRKKRVDEVVQSGKPVRFVDRRNGRIFENHIHPIFDSGENVSAVAVYAKDTTDIVRAETVLRNARKEMEQRVNERTAELLEANRRLMVEVGNRRSIEGVLEDRLRFERILSDLSATFVKLPSCELNPNIERGLKLIVLSLGLDRGVFIEFSPQRVPVITHVFAAPGSPGLGKGPMHQAFPWISKMLGRGETVHLSQLPDILPAEATAEREYAIRKGQKSHLSIPISVGDSIEFAIAFESFRRRREWSEDLIKRLRHAGEIFANAVVRKRAEEKIRRKETALRESQADYRVLAGKLLKTQEEERRRLAREMHDDLVQRLAILSIEVGKIERGKGSSVPSKLKEIREELTNLSTDIHAISRQLHPSILDDLGLVDAIKSECRAFSRREGIVVHFEPKNVPVKMSKDTAICLYRILQEGLRNVAKHAKATQVHVLLTGEQEDLSLRIIDSGIGFDPSRTKKQRGLGLASMQERAHLVNGSLSIHSQEGEGTSIEVRAPLSEKKYEKDASALG